MKLLVSILFVLSYAFTNAYADRKNVSIVIIKSDDLKSTVRSISGAKKVIYSSFENCQFVEYLYFRNLSNEDALIDSINNINPKLILTVGSSATKFSKEKLSNYPTVFSGVIYPENFGIVESLNMPGGNVSGASLNIPLDVQFKYYRSIIPGLEKVGVLYTSKTESLIEDAKVEARKMGIEIISYRIDKKKDIPKAIDSLNKVVDGFWSVADEDLYTKQSIKYILLNTVRKRKPFMGFSRHMVEKGALFALDFNYKAVGRQAGEIVVKVLEGQAIGKIPVSQVNMLWFHYNEKTAKRIAIPIPGELISVAKEVYR